MSDDGKTPAPAPDARECMGRWAHRWTWTPRAWLVPTCNEQRCSTCGTVREVSLVHDREKLG